MLLDGHLRVMTSAAIGAPASLRTSYGHRQEKACAGQTVCVDVGCHCSIYRSNNKQQACSVHSYAPRTEATNSLPGLTLSKSGKMACCLARDLAIFAATMPS